MQCSTSSALLDLGLAQQGPGCSVATALQGRHGGASCLPLQGNPAAEGPLSSTEVLYCLQGGPWSGRVSEQNRGTALHPPRSRRVSEQYSTSGRRQRGREAELKALGQMGSGEAGQAELVLGRGSVPCCLESLAHKFLRFSVPQPRSVEQERWRCFSFALGCPLADQTGPGFQQ